MTPETAEKKAIKDYLNLMGIFNFHVLQGLGCYPGIPDIIAVINGIMIGIEIKAKNKKGLIGKQSDKQVCFQQALENSGGIYICGDFECVKVAIDKRLKKRV
jgi:Holliday junction resolvase